VEPATWVGSSAATTSMHSDLSSSSISPGMGGQELRRFRPRLIEPAELGKAGRKKTARAPVLGDIAPKRFDGITVTAHRE
jgi:hypothetical protein